jgi:glycosyltransferase involved in cell wall biosynthesis
MAATNKTPKVSVCVVTYNHAQYIRECLQSIVDQKTDFDFELVVSDDASTDGTGEIVREFARKYPEIVVDVSPRTNVGPTRNYVATQAAARGEYIAQLDGDDYALPGKLQAQVDCLDTHPDVSFCAHAARRLGNRDGVIGADARFPETGTIADLLLHGTYFVNSSVMYRKKNEFDHSGMEVVDFYLHIERASRGRIFLDRRVFCCYREHALGMSKDIRYRKLMEALYEQAFDRALELGVSYELVQAARLRRRMAFSIARYLDGDVDGYRNRIRLDQEERRFASAKHLLLHWTRFFPGLVGVYARLRGMA